jgi:Family of unknown function (DUF5677)
VGAGLADEAFGMSRTMVEIALNLRFITNRHSEQRAKRFVHYLSRWKLELIRRSLKHFHVVGEDGKFVLDKNGNKIPRHTKSELRQHMRDYATHAKRARKYPSRTSWTETHNRKSKGGVWKMAMEADRYESVNGQPVRWEFDYDWMYFWTSQYVHGTVVALDIHATPVRHPFSVRKAFEVGQVNADLAMFNTAVQLYKILLMAFRALGQPFHPAIEEPLGAFVKRMAK